MSIASTRFAPPPDLAGDVHPPDAGVSRPIGRTGFSLKREAWPDFETSSRSSSPEVSLTCTSSSPSRTLIAMIPSALIGVL